MGDPIAVTGFFTMILAWGLVIGVSLYGTLRCFLHEEFFEGCKILLVLPLWYGAQTLALIAADAAGIQFLESGVGIGYYLAGAALVCYLVIRHVRWLTVPPPGAPKDSGASWFSKQNPADLRRRTAGAIVLIIGIAATSWFPIAGIPFVIAGVSLIMNVRIWRR